MAAIQREIQFYTTEKLDTYFNGRFATFHRIEEVLKEEKSTEIGIPLDAKIFDEQFERDLKKLRNDAQYLFQLNKFYSNTILFPILVRNDLSESQQIYLWLRQLYDLMRISADNNLELPEAINSDNKKFNALYQYNITKYKKMLAENFAGQDNKEFKARQFMTDEMRRFVASMPKWTQLTEEKERCKKIIDKYCKSGSGILSGIFSSDLAKSMGHNYEKNAIALKSAIDNVVTNHSLRELVIAEFQNILIESNQQGKKKSGYLAVLEKVLMQGLGLEEAEVHEIERNRLNLLLLNETEAMAVRDAAASATQPASAELGDKKRNCTILLSNYCGSTSETSSSFPGKLLPSELVRKKKYAHQVEALQSAIDKAENEDALKRVVIEEYSKIYRVCKGLNKEENSYLKLLAKVLQESLGMGEDAIFAIKNGVECEIKAEADASAGSWEEEGTELKIYRRSQ